VEHAGKLKEVTEMGVCEAKGKRVIWDEMWPGKDHIELAEMYLALRRAIMLK
jgi:hypothetical protein